MVGYMIIPLGLTDEEEQIYKMLYKKADFENMESRYTTAQLVADSNPIFEFTVKKVGRILKKLIEVGYLIVIKTGSKGNPTIYKIVKLIEFNQNAEDEGKLKENQRETKGKLKENQNLVIPTYSEDEGKLKENQREIKGKLKVNPIKEKEKEKKYIYSEIDIAEIRKLYPGDKNRKDALEKLPKLLDKYGKEQIIRCVERYKNFVLEKRKIFNQQYQNEKTFWNKGHMDYLDSVYEENNIDMPDVYQNNPWSSIES